MLPAALDQYPRPAAARSPYPDRGEFRSCRYSCIYVFSPTYPFLGILPHRHTVFQIWTSDPIARAFLHEIGPMLRDFFQVWSNAAHPRVLWQRVPPPMPFLTLILVHCSTSMFCLHKNIIALSWQVHSSMTLYAGCFPLRVHTGSI